MKLKPLPDPKIDSFEGRSIDEAFAHFIHSSYDPPNDRPKQLEIRHAFFSGAAYLSNLIIRARDLPEGLRMELVGTLSLDIGNTVAASGQRAYLAANPTPSPSESTDPVI